MADDTDYRLAPAYLLRPAGAVVVLLGAGWLIAVLLGSGRWILALLGLATVVVLVGVTVAAVRPPRVLRLTDEGYLVGWLRGAGVREAGWRSIEAVSTVRVGTDKALCLDLVDGRRTVVPLALLGTHQADAQRDVRQRLDRAYGYRRSAP